jgi:uncharacterized protein YndB with AHSA1/START domain
MASHDIILQVTIDAEADVIMQALTSDTGINGWWSTKAEVGSGAGAPVLVHFPDVPMPFELSIGEQSASKLSWIAGEFPPPWAGTTVRWVLSANPEGSGTVVDFAQTDFPAGHPGIGMIAFTWAQLLGRLQGFAESGQGNPFFLI